MEPLSIKTYVFLVSGCVQGEEESLGFYRQFEKFSIIGKWRGIIGRIISAHTEVTSVIFRLLASFTHKGNVRCKRSVLSSCMGESLMFTGSGESAGALLWLLPLTQAETVVRAVFLPGTRTQTDSQVQDKDQKFRHKSAYSTQGARRHHH